ncbi:MAG: HAD family hydrolase [Desulfuromonadales bacterium]|nr:MAG: HAD family hydrolase [Desulfuromonadales bacterium]
MTQSGIRAIVFDLDGTLYQSEELGHEIAACADRYIADLKGVTPAEAARLIQATREVLKERTGYSSSLSHACIELGGDLEVLHRRFAADIEPERLVKPDERLVRLLKRLGARHELHLYTNNNCSLSGRIMAALGVADLFRRVFTIEDSWRPKPDRDVLEGILRAIGMTPSQCLFVGDRYDIDLRLPAELGCRVFLTQTVDELLTIESIIT